METQNLIIAFFILALVVAGLSSISSAHNKIKVLERIRGRGPGVKNAEALESELSAYANRVRGQEETLTMYRQRNSNQVKVIEQQYKEIEALEHTVGLKSETIEKLLAEIKYNKSLYKLAGVSPAALTAAEVAGRNDSKGAMLWGDELERVLPKSMTEKLAPLRGEWVDETTKTCQEDLQQINSRNEHRAAPKPIPIRGNKVKCKTCGGEGKFRKRYEKHVTPCEDCNGTGRV